MSTEHGDVVSVEQLESLYDEGRTASVLEVVGEEGSPRELDPGSRGRWLRIAGLAALREGQPPRARGFLEEAWALDPLDRETAAALGQIRYAQQDLDGAHACFETLWIHHADTLTPTTRSLTGFRLAEVYRNRGEMELARIVLQRAFTDTPENSGVGLTLLDTLESLGLDERASLVRRRLLDLVQEPKTRARLAQEQAEAYLADDEAERAAPLLAEAYRLQPDEALRQKAETVLREGEHWELLADVLEARVALESDPAHRLERVEELVSLYEERLEDPAGLAERLDRHLNRFPADLKAFEWLTIALGNAEAWEELHNAYARMIQRTHGAEDEGHERLLAVLWRNLAMLLETELSQPTQALHAYRMAYQYGRDSRVQDAILRLAEEVGDEELPLAELTRACDAHPERADLAERLGAALLKRGETDRGYLVLRTAVARGGVSRNAVQAVERLDGHRPDTIRVAIPDEIRRARFRPQQKFSALETLFRVAGHLMGERLHHDIDSFGLRRADRLQDDELLIVRVLEELREAFALPRRPMLFVREGLPGVVNPFFREPTLLVAPEMLRGVSDREMRFVIARALHLMRPEFALTTRLMPPQLRTILAALLQVGSADAAPETSPEVAAMRRDIERKLDPALREALTAAAANVLEGDLPQQLEPWLVAVADEANRVGLFYADDVAAALHGLERITPPHARAAIEARREALLVFSASEGFRAAREQLGTGLASR